MQKLYCYADETGQDTRGRLFIVALIITSEQQSELRMTVQRAEKQSGKAAKKWTNTLLARKQAYLKILFHDRAFQRTIFYKVFSKSTNYLACTLETITQGLKKRAPREYKATVIIDSLSKKEGLIVGSRLRRSGIHIEKVRGMSHNSDEFIRLADAVAGFTRDYVEGLEYAIALYEKAKALKIIEEL